MGNCYKALFRSVRRENRPFASNSNYDNFRYICNHIHYILYLCGRTDTKDTPAERARAV